ncbi:hypothetical protein QR98_0068160 [Sarcoptes scabiei]|uniref:Uncharacterized protein n=1 Tax=Sarcoptes scabiei TaxID=52283 RepID=A0A132ACW9_SARSC|nr:hypothetical protein QR98_0068160 [Sarcoptes scabiei]
MQKYQAYSVLLSLQFVRNLNEILPKPQCVQLQLKSIQEAILYGQIKITDQQERLQQIELTIELKPSGAILRTMIEPKLLADGITYRLMKFDQTLEIERLDTYHNQSICIDDRVLRKYCYCATNLFRSKIKMKIKINDGDV